MEQEQLAEKLKSMGVNTTNCYPKASFIKEDEIFVGLFKREMEEDFYFYNRFDKKIYALRKPNNLDSYEEDKFQGKTKYLVPLKECEVIWEDKPYEELPDKPYKEMTLREHACIQLRVPDSGLPWLDHIISKSEGSNVRDI